MIDSKRRLFELYNQVMDLPPNERSDFLDQVCGNSETRKKVEDLLATEEKTGVFLERSALEEEAVKLASHADPYRLRGEVLGKYRIEELIAIGGMGAIYRARNQFSRQQDVSFEDRLSQQSVSRKFAFKILLPDVAYGNQKITDRFNAEAKILGKLKHPNIVEVYEAGEAVVGNTPYFYIAMEWLEGRTLAQEIEEQGPLSLRRTAHLLRQIADALSIAHENKIIHRDLKPSNVMLVKRTDGSEQIKILDFGIAKALDDGLRTSTTSRWGTPQYASPEYLVGQPIDERSDIFMLGIMLYQMLTGTLPFLTGPNQPRIYPPPLMRSLRKDIPVATDAFVRQLLAANQEERPSKVRDIPRAFENTYKNYDSIRIAVRINQMEGDLETTIKKGREALKLAPDDTDLQALVEKSLRESRTKEYRQSKRGRRFEWDDEYCWLNDEYGLDVEISKYFFSNSENCDDQENGENLSKLDEISALASGWRLKLKIWLIQRKLQKGTAIKQNQFYRYTLLIYKLLFVCLIIPSICRALLFEIHKQCREKMQKSHLWRTYSYKRKYRLYLRMRAPRKRRRYWF